MRTKLKQRAYKTVLYGFIPFLLLIKVWQNKFGFDELKNIAGQVLTYNSMNFHWLNKKIDLEWIMNGFEKIDMSQIAVREQKITIEKANFCSNTVFSLYFKIRAKKSRRKTYRFSLQLLFRRDQNHYFNLTSKTDLKMILKTDLKKTAPQ